MNIELKFAFYNYITKVKLFIMFYIYTVDEHGILHMHQESNTFC